MNSINLLYENALNAFVCEQEVQEIFLFGSFARGTYDQYSDIDLSIVSYNFEKTMEHLPQILAQIGNVLVQYPLSTGKGSAAYMTLFKNYPLYNKLDFNIVDAMHEKLFADAKSVFHREGPFTNQPSDFIPPLFEQRPHRLFDSYLGAIRYTKYRKRDMHFSAHKFYRAQLDQFLQGYYWQATGDIHTDRLGILKYQILDKLDDQKKLQRYLYPEHECAMNALYLELLHSMFNNIEPDLDSCYVFVAREIFAFLTRELAC